MDAVRQLHRLLRLVRLEMADEMPDHPRIGAGDFGFEFLNAVFAEFQLSCTECVEDVGEGKGFGDRQKTDRCGIASCLFRGLRNARADRFKMVADGIFVHRPASSGFLMVSSGSAMRTFVPGGTLSVSQTFPPMTEFAPIVTFPRMVAPA